MDMLADYKKHQIQNHKFQINSNIKKLKFQTFMILNLRFVILFLCMNKT